MGMNKFSQFMQESLTAEIMTEPSSEASGMAKKMGLTYVGFGRYADRSGKVKYITKNDKLYPFKGKDVETGSVENIDSQIDAAQVKGNEKSLAVLNKKQKDAMKGIEIDSETKKTYFDKNYKKVMAYNDQLSRLYQPDLFTAEEIDALRSYTQDSFNPINRYLYKGFDPETTPDQANQIVNQIAIIDNAFEEAGAPFDYTVYTGLSSRYDFRKMKPGKQYAFRGYISTTLNHDTAIELFGFDEENQAPGVMLEIDIKHGQKSIYLENLTDNEGEFETLLPRGTKINIDAGPMMVDADITSGGMTGKQIALFKCSIVEE